MKKEISKNQQEIIDAIINEFSKINEKEQKANGKSPFNLSDIVNDVAHKQKTINENEALKKVFTKEIYKQMALDIKKLKKALEPIGFRVETYKENSIRKRYENPIDCPTIVISHLTNRYQVNFSTYEEHFDLEYKIIHDRSKRADLDTPIGFVVDSRERGYNGRITTKTVEEAMQIENQDYCLRQWIKKQYESATIKRAA